MLDWWLLVLELVIYSFTYHVILSQVKVNGVELLVRDAIDGINILECSHQCQQPDVCNEGSRCVAMLEGYRCACPLYKNGSKCDQGMSCLSVNERT